MTTPAVIFIVLDLVTQPKIDHILIRIGIRIGITCLEDAELPRALICGVGISQKCSAKN